MEEASDPPHLMGYGAGAFYVYEPLVGGCGLVCVAGEDGTEGAPVLRYDAVPEVAHKGQGRQVELVVAIS